METVFWSDSMVALYWLREKGGWSVFVSNRIKEIRNLFPNSEWCHVPGKINPANLISRGCSPSHLVESHWWKGPLWLVESPVTWPITKLPDSNTSEISLERKKLHGFLDLLIMLEAEAVTERKDNCLLVVGQLDKLESAEIQLNRSVQAQSFTDEKLISNLSVFRDDNNIIRVKT
ncbi:integrase catalytic domain-containing protein [Trichonephila clavipes]|uniref:Integrase catalytic domain-containing protein n=1 Tax=Trichonephila clavipes TaxID=2585209 RepID=A0A8X6RUC3_TRICX|nr:integrase catalytic domain-containing protein [Trichonephila clavipes]